MKKALTIKKNHFIFISLCVFVLMSLCSCTIKSNRKISEKTLNDRKAAYEKYLKDTYPDETFSVSVWQEYAENTGGAGLPDYEGYVIRTVITDSKGNRFKIKGDSPDKYYDDYKDVLEGSISYNEKGQHIYYDDSGEVLFVSDY